MTNIDASFGAFRASAEQLQQSILKARSLFEELHMTDWTANADSMVARLSSDAFKVLVIGEFKRGKSTFINALLREEVLPAFATPCTAVINEIKYGDRKEATLHFRHDAKLATRSDLPAAVKAHSAKHSEEPCPPLVIDVADLEEYVVISDPAEDQARSVAGSPYDRVEIRWPLEICKNGVELIDSPGLNEHGIRTKVTTDYLSKVDAVLFVMSCQALGSQSELAVIDHQIRAAGHREIFFVANRFDEIRERERDRLVAYAQKRLAERTEFGTEGIFFLSALKALDGRLAGDTDMVAESGIERVEARLAHFLTHHRGRLKLLQPTSQLLEGISRALNEVIPGQRSMLRQGEAELRQRYDQVKPELEDVERKRNQIIRQLNGHRQRLRDEVVTMVRSRQREIAGLLHTWLAESELSQELNILSLSAKEQLTAIAEEVLEVLSTRIEQEQFRWQQEVLQPIVDKHLTNMTADLNTEVGDFLTRLDNVISQMTGIDPDASAAHKELSPLERVLAATGGFFVGGFGSALVGGALGFGEMLKSLIPQLALTIAMLMVGVTNPLIMVPVLLGGGLLQGLRKQGQLTTKTRTSVVENMVQQMRENAHEVGETVGHSILEQTASLVESVEEGLRREIQTIKDQVEAALNELQSGEADVKDRQTVIDETAKKLADIDRDMRELTLELAAGRAL